jgi:hypothetical protein
MNKATMWEQLRVQLEEGKRPPRARRRPADAAPASYVKNW